MQNKKENKTKIITFWKNVCFTMLFFFTLFSFGKSVFAITPTQVTGIMTDDTHLSLYNNQINNPTNW